MKKLIIHNRLWLCRRRRRPARATKSTRERERKSSIGGASHKTAKATTYIGKHTIRSKTLSPLISPAASARGVAANNSLSSTHTQRRLRVNRERRG